MIQEITKTIQLLFQTLVLGSKVVVEEAKPYAKLYSKGLLWLALIAILSPVPFLIIGIILDLRWLIALAGVWWAFWTFLLLILALPVGILIESFTRGIKGSGQRYIKVSTGILIVELCISLFASIIPIKANLAMFPLLIVSAIILGLLNVWLFSRKVIAPLVSIIFIALLLSFFFPATFETLGLKISDVDISIAEPQRLNLTLDDIEKQRIKFFHPDGRPRVWYYKTADGRFEFFDKKGHHPIYKEKLKAVTPDVVSQIERQLNAEVERRVQEEQRKQEEVKIQEEMKRIESIQLERQQITKEHEDYLSRYILSRSFVNRLEYQDVVVLIIDEDNRVNNDATQKIASLLKIKGFNTTASFFNGNFVSDGIFEKVFSGDTGEVKKLELVHYSDHMILGRKSLNFKENPGMQNMITAQATIEIHIISAKTGEFVESINISEVGAGFSRETAEGLAMERVIQKLDDRNWNATRKGET